MTNFLYFISVIFEPFLSGNNFKRKFAEKQRNFFTVKLLCYESVISQLYHYIVDELALVFLLNNNKILLT